MFKKKYMIYGVAGILIVGFAIVLGYHHLSKGVCISIHNTSNADIDNIALVYTGGTKHIKTLKAKAIYKTYINPQSESHLNLSWIDPMGEKHSDRIDVYIEPDYIGSVNITINPDYEISWIDNLKSAPLGKL